MGNNTSPRYGTFPISQSPAFLRRNPPAVRMKLYGDYMELSRMRFVGFSLSRNETVRFQRRVVGLSISLSPSFRRYYISAVRMNFVIESHSRLIVISAFLSDVYYLRNLGMRRLCMRCLYAH